MYDVVGIGENSIDDVYRLPAYPQPHTDTAKLPILSRDILPGGQVATTLATCASLGLTTTYAGVFGNDDNGRRIREELTARGVDVGDAIVRDAPNRHAVILIDHRHGERVVLWQRDPRLNMTDDELRREVITGARVLHVDNTDEAAAITAARLARDAGRMVTTDIDMISDRTPELLRLATVAIVAEHVPAALTGITDVEQALLAMQRDFAASACVTLGARGSMLCDGDGVHTAAAFQVEVVDSTGAGDVFRGAFITAMLRGDRPESILRFANAAAAVSCTRQGALGGVPTREEIGALVGSGSWSG